MSTLTPHDQFADDADELGWDRAAHGRMAEYADDGTTVHVQVHEGHDVHAPLTPQGQDPQPHLIAPHGQAGPRHRAGG